MSFTISDILKTIGQAEFEGDPAYKIEAPATLGEAGPHNISLFAQPKYADGLAASQAGCVVTAAGLKKESQVFKGHKIFVANAQVAWARLLGLWERNLRQDPWGIDPAAIVSRTARLGKNVSIGALTIVEDRATIGDGTGIYPQCYIGRDVSIGSGCLIYPRVVIRERVKIGDRVIIQPGVVIGGDGFGFLPADSQPPLKVPQVGTVEIGDDVELGSNTTIDRATTGATKIGSGTKIDNLVQIGHNVKVGKRCLFAAQVGIAGSTSVGDDAIFGGQVGIADHVKIASGTIVGAQAGVVGNIKAKDILWGTPARNHREALKLSVLYGKLPEIYETVKKLKNNAT